MESAGCAVVGDIRGTVGLEAIALTIGANCTQSISAESIERSLRDCECDDWAIADR
jgi:hypothetical protein